MSCLHAHLRQPRRALSQNKRRALTAVHSPQNKRRRAGHTFRQLTTTPPQQPLLLLGQLPQDYYYNRHYPLPKPQLTTTTTTIPATSRALATAGACAGASATTTATASTYCRANDRSQSPRSPNLEKRSPLPLATFNAATQQLISIIAGPVGGPRVQVQDIRQRCTCRQRERCPGHLLDAALGEA